MKSIREGKQNSLGTFDHGEPHYKLCKICNERMRTKFNITYIALNDHNQKYFKHLNKGKGILTEDCVKYIKKCLNTNRSIDLTTIEETTYYALYEYYTNICNACVLENRYIEADEIIKSFYKNKKELDTLIDSLGEYYC